MGSLSISAQTIDSRGVRVYSGINRFIGDVIFDSSHLFIGAIVFDLVVSFREV